MARITVEDCITVIPNRFELVIIAAHRAKQIASGSAIQVERDNDKNPVISLREIAEHKIDPNIMRSSLLDMNRLYAKPSAVDEDMDGFFDQESSDNAGIDAMFAQNQSLGFGENIDEEQSNDDMNDDSDLEVTDNFDAEIFDEEIDDNIVTEKDSLNEQDADIVK